IMAGIIFIFLPTFAIWSVTVFMSKSAERKKRRKFGFIHYSLKFLWYLFCAVLIAAWGFWILLVYLEKGRSVVGLANASMFAFTMVATPFLLVYYFKRD